MIRGIGAPDLGSLQSAGAVPKQLRGAITYVAGTTGAIGSTALFTVTGDVLITGWQAKCTTDLTSAGAPTWQLGAVGATTILFDGPAPDVTGWDAGEWLNTATVTYTTGAGAAGADSYTAISANIVQTIASATITGGVVRWYLSYIPLSGDGLVTLHANLVAF